MKKKMGEKDIHLHTSVRLSDRLKGEYYFALK